jgi:hypothetical protein
MRDQILPPHNLVVCIELRDLGWDADSTHLLVNAQQYKCSGYVVVSFRSSRIQRASKTLRNVQGALGLRT